MSRSDNEEVAEIDLDEFMAEVSQLVEDEIEECVNSIQKDLLKMKDPQLTAESIREVDTQTDSVAYLDLKSLLIY